MKTRLWVFPIALVCLCMIVPAVQAGAAQPLRELAAKHGVLFGAAVGAAFWSPDSAYRKILERECSIIVAENEMKFNLIEPESGRFNWTRADDLVAFARKNNMKIRGHNLVWHAQSDWASKLNAGRGEMIAVMRAHILAVAGRYSGKILEWDVVNEAIDDGDGFLRDTFWKRTIGDDYIDLAFRFAHEADPHALLFYNDYGGEDMNVKSDKIYRLVKDICARVAAPRRGPPVPFVTGEIDTAGNRRTSSSGGASASGVGHRTGHRLKHPADATCTRAEDEYRAIHELFLQNPQCCPAFLTLGITDKYSWIPQFSRDTARAPLRRELRAQPPRRCKTALDGGFRSEVPDRQ